MQPREIVAGRFEIAELAGKGGMGAVYRALDRQTGEVVALKVLHGHSTELTERFAREARLLSELRHPGIVRFVASGATPDGEGFLVMEWLDGETLGARFRRGPMSPAEVIALGARIADALRPAHERGIVHRDLKPPNLFLERGDLDRVKVLDFGIARIVEPGQQLTATGMMLGTPGYMSPEQARGDRDVDPRTDVYALGCVLFRALTGRRAFEGADLITALLKATREPLPRASQLRPDVPPALDDLLFRMLSPTPDGRPRDGGALVAELTVIGGFQTGGTAIVPSSRARAPAPPSGFAALPPSSFIAGPPPSAATGPRSGHAGGPHPAPLPSGHAGPQPGYGAPPPGHAGLPHTMPSWGQHPHAHPAPTAGPYAPMPGGQMHPFHPQYPPPEGGSSRSQVIVLVAVVGVLLVLLVVLGAIAVFVLASPDAHHAGPWPGA